ncbi:GtrA family protein [Cellulomonas sp. URHE0023]|uniref:GtrA family protein n=1 Tax=Cellulomonas sp. URHE0023 TaxID=1380354 RepID=UPI0009E08B1E|nr:GtrA family protein [Cellulomonas sp. URHE0023]
MGDELADGPSVPRGSTTPGRVLAPGAAVAVSSARERAYEILRFLSVGGLAFIVDLGLFNLLRFGPGHLLEHKPVTAKVVSLVAATLVSWVGNRHWTFSRQRTDRQGRELIVFATVNIVCAGIPIVTLALSHYILGLANALADNVATVIGIGIGTVLRYAGYKRWVFTGHSVQPALRR